MVGAENLGCNAHIVRLTDIQRVSKNDPRGYEIDKCLIMSQTNNVCVAPFVRVAATIKNREPRRTKSSFRFFMVQQSAVVPEGDK